MYDGYVSRIDTLSLTIDATLKAGPNPEEMTVATATCMLLTQTE